VHGTPQGGGGTEWEAVRCGRAGCEGAGRLRRDLTAPTGNRPSGLSSSLSRVEQAVADTAERAADLAKTQISADGTLRQAIAHTRTCQLPPPRSRLRG
jgi:hypothetical protein